MAFNFNCIVEIERLFKVTSSYIHHRSGSISEFRKPCKMKTSFLQQHRECPYCKPPRMGFMYSAMYATHHATQVPQR